LTDEVKDLPSSLGRSDDVPSEIPEPKELLPETARVHQEDGAPVEMEAGDGVAQQPSGAPPDSAYKDAEEEWFDLEVKISSARGLVLETALETQVICESSGKQFSRFRTKMHWTDSDSVTFNQKGPIRLRSGDTLLFTVNGQNETRPSCVLGRAELPTDGWISGYLGDLPCESEMENLTLQVRVVVK